MKTTTKLGVGEHINDEVDVVFVGVSGLEIIEVEGEEHGLAPGGWSSFPRVPAFDPGRVGGLRLSHRSQAAGPLQIGR